MTKKTTSTASGSTLVRELADILDDAGLVELEYATDDVNIRLSRASGAVAAPMAVAPAPAAPAAAPPIHPRLAQMELHLLWLAGGLATLRGLTIEISRNPRNPRKFKKSKKI